jgi:hypothetical protein
MKIAVFWVVAPCSLVEVYQRFRGACCLHHHRRPVDEASTSETSVNYQITRRKDPENNHLHTCSRKNQKSHTTVFIFIAVRTQNLSHGDFKNNKQEEIYEKRLLMVE